MAELVTMPKLGFDMAEGTLVRWVKAEGDSVEKGDVIAEIETDKATVEVEASGSGVMFRHLVEEETTLPINAPIAVIADEGEEPSQDEIDAMVKEAGGEPSAEKPKQQEKPAEKEAKTEAAEAEEPESEEAPEEKPEEEQEEEQEEGVSPAGGVRSSPLARRMAEDEEIDLEKVEGSGPRGRVVKKDVKRYLESMREEGREEEAEAVEEALQPITAFAVGEVARRPGHRDEPLTPGYWSANAGFQPEFPSFLYHPIL